MIIGAGGVSNVTTQKCGLNPDVFSEILLASRTESKCKEIAARTKIPVHTAKVDADDANEVAALIKDFKPKLVINLALPYQDLAIMDGCLKTGVDYLDTANYEPKDEAKFCYKWQWDYQERFAKAGLMALLGCGFDPGVTNIYCAYAQKHHYDEINYIDIFDCNAGSHGKAFATNFNPEINIREITQRGKFWEDGQWKETDPLSVHFDFDYPTIGPKDSYLMYHEELESLVKNINGLKRIRFWMTFGQEYLTHLRVLQNVGMTRIDPVMYEGKEIVPLQFLKAVLPDPGSLAEGYTGKTCIGCVFKGKKAGKDVSRYIYNICDHAQCHTEVHAQAISYTTGVPAMIGAMMMLKNTWRGKGVFNVEQFNPDPFMEQLNIHGLPWIDTEYHATL